jgi:hypothetical protein
LVVGYTLKCLRECRVAVEAWARRLPAINAVVKTDGHRTPGPLLLAAACGNPTSYDHFNNLEANSQELVS